MMPDEPQLKRDQMHRCKICKKLSKDSECQLDPILGLLCPNGCKPPYIQLPYDSPLQDDEPAQINPKKMQ